MKLGENGCYMRCICAFKLSGVSGWLGSASPRLAKELEELGRALEQEAIEIEAHMVRRSAAQNVIEH